jgi:hypothetical protein
MYRLLTLLAGLGLLLVPTASLGADGDNCSTAATDFDSLTQGQMRPIWCVVLCDNDTTDAACTNFDLLNVGIPDALVFELHEVDIDASGGAGDCTAGTVTFATSNDAGLTTASENVFGLDPVTTSVSIGGTTRLVVDTRTAPTGRYLMATTSNLGANCTSDGIDILAIGYTENNQ